MVIEPCSLRYIQKDAGPPPRDIRVRLAYLDAFDGHAPWLAGLLREGIKNQSISSNFLSLPETFFYRTS